MKKKNKRLTYNPRVITNYVSLHFGASVIGSKMIPAAALVIIAYNNVYL